MISSAVLAYSLALLAAVQGTTMISTTVPDDNAVLVLQKDIFPHDANKSDESTPHRIVGGHPISIREAPWQVAIIVDKAFNCGGSVISTYWVLTAAHCTTTGTAFAVRAGTRYFKRGGQTRHVTLVVRNGRYNPYTSINDIAMLRVNRAFSFSRDLRPVQLATRTSRLPSTVSISGWGSISQNDANPRLGLRSASLQPISRATCERQYQAYGGVPRSAFCATEPGRDSCYGDSGGALVRNGVQYGIVSFGNGCAQRGFAGVYTDVRFERRWITHVARQYNGF